MAYDFADAYQGHTIYYSYVTNQSGTGVKVTYETNDYNSYSGAIEIPSTATNSTNEKTYNVTQIGASAFRACSGLTSVSLPSSITYIDSYAFYQCNNASFTSISIPDAVTFLGTNVFYGCSNLTSVTIPSNVTSIGMNAFQNCTSLTSMTIPSGVTTIQMNTFNGCSKLEEVTIPSSVTSIGMSAFNGCSKLSTINDISNVNSLGAYAFQNCSSLESITIPSGVTAIPSLCFAGCSGLTSITIPSSITSIGSNVFQNCTGLTEINYNVTTHSNFTNSTKPFKGCSTNNITLTIGANVTSIPAYAFSGTKTSGTLIIPSSVTTIGTKAFENNLGKDNTNLATIYMLGTNPPTIDDANIFKTSSGYCDINVLFSSDNSIIERYTTADNWSTFSSSISETTSVTIANMDLTNGSLTIPAGNAITITGTLINSDASHLVIKDGGQLIISSAKADVKATFQKEITAYTQAGGKDNYYIIANPTTGSINPTTVSGMLDNNYDLYYFDEAQSGAEWRNYKQEVFNLVNGKGYLYANSSNLTLEFPGTVLPGTTANITLSKSGSGTYNGFNLVGNPLSNNVRSMKIGESSCSYYKVNSSTGVFAASEADIIVGEAFMVEAPSNGATLQLNPSAKDEAGFTNEVIRLEVSNSKFTDVAYVYFGNHLPLTKINHLNDEAPMLYIHNEDSDKAVAVYNNRGEVKSINVNFEAKTIGTYTISAKMVKGEIKYMHLYDRFTGIDTDLLIDDYSFIGANEDQPGRFILKLEAIDNEFEGSDNFAYQSGNNIMVNGEGELQIFDVMGRMVMNERINGVESISGLSRGIYIFRVIGETQKTQKIVVR